MPDHRCLWLQAALVRRVGDRPHSVRIAARSYRLIGAVGHRSIKKLRMNHRETSATAVGRKWERHTALLLRVASWARADEWRLWAALRLFDLRVAGRLRRFCGARSQATILKLWVNRSRPPRMLWESCGRGADPPRRRASPNLEAAGVVVRVVVGGSAAFHRLPCAAERMWSLTVFK